MSMPNLVLHIPHASRIVPEEEGRRFLIGTEALQSELMRMTDAHTDELFPVTSNEAARVVFPVSRLVCDVERFPRDANEIMATHGMGAIYTRTSDGEALRSAVSDDERQRLLKAYYYPHHRALTAAVDEVLRTKRSCIVVDCHSFASTPLPHEFDQSLDRPNICIGTDPIHTPEDLRDAAAVTARIAGYSVMTNRPFSGSIVPASHQEDARVLSLMIEVNRGLYMNEQTGERLGEFDDVRCALALMLERLSHCGADMEHPG
jgi:N-formylglutamate amidohydrolase